MNIPYLGPPTPGDCAPGLGRGHWKGVRKSPESSREGGLLTRDYKHPGDIYNQITQGLGSSGPVNAK